MKQPKQRVVILNGPKGVGKDTIGKLLCKRLDAQHVQFKDRLFELALQIAGVTEEDWFERYDNRELKEEPWDALGGLSQRQFLIRISEDWIKPTFGADYFGNFAGETVGATVSDCVFTDGGFNEECEPLMTLEGAEVFCFHLKREGCKFDSTDSRGYIGNVPQTFTIVLEEGNPVKSVEDILDVLDTYERQLDLYLAV